MLPFPFLSDVADTDTFKLSTAPLIDVEMDEIMRIFDTNVFATIRTAKAVIPHMAARKRGTVVNVGSIAGNMSVPLNPSIHLPWPSS